MPSVCCERFRRTTVDTCDEYSQLSTTKDVNERNFTHFCAIFNKLKKSDKDSREDKLGLGGSVVAEDGDDGV